MEDRILKVGVVGLRRGLTIVEGLVGYKGAAITAVCDKLPVRLENATKVLGEKGVTGIKCYESYEDFLASDVEAVIIATDAPLHTPMAIQALDAGKHVLSEIPAVNGIEDIKALKAAVKRHPELTYVAAENCCYWAFIETWKKMYENGDFGQAIYAESEYLHAFPVIPPDSNEDSLFKSGWRYDYDAIKYLTHNLGPLLYILEDRCVSVSCISPDVKYNPYMNDYQNGIAVFKTEKGAVIKILIAWGMYVGHDHNYTLYGTKGSIFTDRIKRFPEAHSFAKLSGIPGTENDPVEIPVKTKFRGEPDSGHGGADGKMVKDFARCIIDGTKPRNNIDAAINMALPGLIAAESARCGGEFMEIPIIY